MTSKQALFNLVRIHYGYENKNDFDECVNVLEKDLEVLEFLKSRLDMEVIEDTLYIENGAITITPLHPDDERLLKEWLEK